jgi:hypothetical protein
MFRYSSWSSFSSPQANACTPLLPEQIAGCLPSDSFWFHFVAEMQQSHAIASGSCCTDPAAACVIKCYDVAGDCQLHFSWMFMDLWIALLNALPALEQTLGSPCVICCIALVVLQCAAPTAVAVLLGALEQSVCPAAL